MCDQGVWYNLGHETTWQTRSWWSMRSQNLRPWAPSCFQGGCAVWHAMQPSWTIMHCPPGTLLRRPKARPVVVPPPQHRPRMVQPQPPTPKPLPVTPSANVVASNTVRLPTEGREKHGSIMTSIPVTPQTVRHVSRSRSPRTIERTPNGSRVRPRSVSTPRTPWSPLEEYVNSGRIW